jgi:hypothetical protein
MTTPPEPVFKYPIPASPVPHDYIPRGGVIFCVTDFSGSGEAGVTVKGFRDPVTGDIHIQEIEETKP